MSPPRKRFRLAAWDNESESREIRMPGHLIRLKKLIPRVVRHCRAETDRLMPLHFTSVLIGWLLAQSNGVRFFAHSAALMIGTALLVRCAVHLVAKPRVCEPLRNAISSRFASWPPVLGFSVMLFLAVPAVVAEVMALRGFMTPADSWPFVTFGFLYGIMSVLMRSMDRRFEKRREDSVSNDTQAPSWVRYDPSGAQK